MLHSMTGYGRGDATKGGIQLTVEVTSVNRKSLEVLTALPKELETLETSIRDEVKQRIPRGRVHVRLLLEATDRTIGRPKLNTALAKAYYEDFRRLQEELDLSGPITLEQIVRAPGVLETGSWIEESAAFWPAVQRALRQALQALVKMRRQEGRHLAKDLAGRIKTMRSAVAQIRKQAPQVVERYRRQLRERLQEIDDRLSAEDRVRLDKELVLLADRSDISEELSRLESHFGQFDRYAKSKEPVGRTLDFLAQEMNREINTIGSKANDTAISHQVVALKTELEKFREQVQNVE